MSSDMKRLQRENFQDGRSWSAAQPGDPVPRPLITAAVNLILMREISLSLIRDVYCISYRMHVPLSYMEKNKYIVPGVIVMSLVIK